MNVPGSRWVNTEPDAGLPQALLERLALRVPVGIIEEVWLFPTRRTVAGESTVFVVAAVEPEPDKRRVITARYTVTRDRRGAASVQEQIDEHGTAPAAAVTRIVHGVLHRMDQEGEQPPRAARIERDQERWGELLESLGGTRPAQPAPPAPAEASPEGAAPSAENTQESAGPGAERAQESAGAGAERAPRDQADRPGAASRDAAELPDRGPSGAGGVIDGENEIGYQ